MKRILSILPLLILSISLYAQKDITEFLGIPVDGSKSEMIQKLKAKGYVSSPLNKDVLEGEFNGKDVNIHVVTNNNKVYRIMVIDANGMSEGDIKIRFNRLCEQFQNNKKYIPDKRNLLLSDDDISYEMTVNKKRYEALFTQKTAAYDSLIIKKDSLSSQKADFDKQAELIKRIAEESLKSLNKAVWFMISERQGKYYISMFYDNEYNRANGEDL